MALYFSDAIFHGTSPESGNTYFSNSFPQKKSFPDVVVFLIFIAAIPLFHFYLGNALKQ